MTSTLYPVVVVDNIHPSYSSMPDAVLPNLNLSHSTCCTYLYEIDTNIIIIGLITCNWMHQRSQGEHRTQKGSQGEHRTQKGSQGEHWTQGGLFRSIQT